MAEVHLRAGGEAGLAHMVAGLIEANLDADPSRERLLSGRRGAVEIVVFDSGVTVGVTFVPGAVTVTDAPVPGADLRVATGADDLMALTTVPLRAGLPDPTTPAGRAVVAAMLRGRLRARGLPGGLGALRTLTRLLSVA